MSTNQTTNAETTPSADQAVKPDSTNIDKLDDAVNRALGLLRIFEERLVNETSGGFDSSDNVEDINYDEILGFRVLIKDSCNGLRAAKADVYKEWEKLRDYYEANNKTA